MLGCLARSILAKVAWREWRGCLVPEAWEIVDDGDELRVAESTASMIVPFAGVGAIDTVVADVLHAQIGRVEFKLLADADDMLPALHALLISRDALICGRSSLTVMVLTWSEIPQPWSRHAGGWEQGDEGGARPWSPG